LPSSGLRNKVVRGVSFCFEDSKRRIGGKSDHFEQPKDIGIGADDTHPPEAGGFLNGGEDHAKPAAVQIAAPSKVEEYPSSAARLHGVFEKGCV
jgi:hypothetical protein